MEGERKGRGSSPKGKGADALRSPKAARIPVNLKYYQDMLNEWKMENDGTKSGRGGGMGRYNEWGNALTAMGNNGLIPKYIGQKGSIQTLCSTPYSLYDKRIHFAGNVGYCLRYLSELAKLIKVCNLCSNTHENGVELRLFVPSRKSQEKK